MINAEALVVVPKEAVKFYRQLYNDTNYHYIHGIDIYNYIFKKIMLQDDLSKLNENDIQIKLFLEVKNEY